MIIESIEITNFKSIYEPLKLNFTDIKGLWQINGNVGAGKTTIGEAIIYGLFGSVPGKNNSDLISWGRKHGSIEVWCKSKGRNIHIKRELNEYGQSPMSVEVDGEELIFTNKRDAQLQLEQEYYDTSKMTLELLCIISFNNFKSLATLNTGDTKKFLDQVLGFYVLTGYADACKEFLMKSRAEESKITNEWNSIGSQITKLEQLANKIRIDGSLDDAKKEMDDWKSKEKNIKSQYDTLIKDIDVRFTELNKELNEIIMLGKNKAKEIKFIEQGTCPTCGAPIDQSQLSIKKKEKELLTEQYTSKKKIIDDIIKEKVNTNTECEQKLIDIRNKYQECYTLYIKLQEQEKHIAVNIKEIEDLKIKQSELYSDIKIQEQESSEWDMLYNILTVDIRTKILESFIPVLNKNILKYSQRLQMPYIITYDSFFKCKITLCGMDKEISISSLSTGQLKTVDMIIILGVLDTIIGSNGINIIFLDELFSNLNTELRNEMCAVLKETISPDITMFIISHMPMDDKYFDGALNLKLEQENKYEKHTITNIMSYRGRA